MKKIRFRHNPIKGVAQVITYPFRKFVQTASNSGNLLMIALAVGWLWANSDYKHEYHALWEQTYAGVFFGDAYLKKTLHHWINDGLMAVFFFMVGLEIKRELLAGELSEPRKALFPVAAAVGGMVTPALLYIAFQGNNPDAMRGWAIPTATDIAFALGVLSLLGSRAPMSLKIFLTALAIVDDIGAILLIGIFYSAPPNWIALGFAGIVLAFMFYLNHSGVRKLSIYGWVSTIVWCAFLASGVHATLAGVLAAFTIPVKVAVGRKSAAEKGSWLANKLNDLSASKKDVLGDSTYHSVLSQMSNLYEQAGTPLQRLEHKLHPVVGYAILPIFALANGGVTLDASLLGTALGPMSLGIIAGLCLGKPLGIVGICWLLEKLRFAERPDGMSWRELWAGGCFAGIGFTMSIFIAGLAFDDIRLLDQSKLAIMIASLLSTAFGILLLTRQKTTVSAAGNEEPEAVQH